MSRHLVIAGAQRCGTTRLYTLLQQHPDICMARPMRPEPKFFLAADAGQASGAAYRKALFPHLDGQAVLGEKSTSYLEHPEVAGRIHAVLPDATLVFVLRDPVRRAWSNWRFSRANGLETLDFEAALDAEDARLRDPPGVCRQVSVNPFAYTRRGDYARQLAAWAEVFPRRQIALLVSEQLFADLQPVRSLFRRLDIDPHAPLLDQGRVNASGHEESGPPPTATARLREQFRDSIARLAHEWAVDVSAWQ